jgi:hypothetical protein
MIVTAWVTAPATPPLAQQLAPRHARESDRAMQRKKLATAYLIFWLWHL